MKKAKLLTLILFIGIISHLSAQEDELRKFRFGLHFSPNIAWLNPSSDGYEKNGSSLGFSYGLSAEFFLAKNYLFSTGLTLNKLGGNLSYFDHFHDADNNVYSFTQIDQSYSLKYIEIPLTLKLRTNEIGYMTYYGNFGVKTGFNYSSNGDFDYKNISGGISKSDVDIKDDIKFFNAWLVIGIGAEYSISGNTAVMFGITFNNGFINTLDNKLVNIDGNGAPIYNTDGTPNYKNKSANANLNYFSLDLGIYF